MIFSAEGKDNGKGISLLEDRLGFQRDRIVTAVGGTSILLGRKHGRSAFRFPGIGVFVDLDAVVDIRSIKGEGNGFQLFSAGRISTDGKNICQTFSVVQIQGGGTKGTVVLIIMIIIIGFFQIKGIGKSVFSVIQRLIFIGNIEVTAIAEAGSMAVFGDPGTGSRRAAAFVEMISGIIIIPADQSYDMVVVGSNLGIIITAAGRKITAVIIKSRRNGSIFHDQFFYAVQVCSADEAGILKMGCILVSQRGIQRRNCGSSFIGSHGFRNGTCPTGQFKHGEEVVSTGFQIVSGGRRKTDRVVFCIAKRIGGSMEEKVRQMKFGKINRRIGQTFFDQAGFAGTESTKSPTGSPGILVADGSDQSQFAGIITLRKGTIGAGIGIRGSVVRERGKLCRRQGRRNISRRNGSACQKAGTGQNQCAENLVERKRICSHSSLSSFLSVVKFFRVNAGFDQLLEGTDNEVFVFLVSNTEPFVVGGQNRYISLSALDQLIHDGGKKIFGFDITGLDLA